MKNENLKPIRIRKVRRKLACSEVVPIEKPYGD
jgi:hypothetical protein